MRRVQYHGQKDSRLYGIWKGMKKRCYQKNRDEYVYYGGQGVVVCDEWRNHFKAFWEWALANGYQDDLTIDRLDPSGNYDPGNCRWLSMEVNNKQNRGVAKAQTTARKYAGWGEDKSVGQWFRDERCEVPLQRLKDRLREGWPVERAMTEPVRPHRPYFR